MTGEKGGGRGKEKRSICTLQDHPPSPAHHISFTTFILVSILIKKTTRKGFHANPRSTPRGRGGCPEYNLLPLTGTRDRHAAMCPPTVPPHHEPHKPPLPGQGAMDEDLLTGARSIHQSPRQPVPLDRQGSCEHRVGSQRRRGVRDG